MSPKADYSGKNVLITGSRRGVGKLITDHFLDCGATVIGIAIERISGGTGVE